MNLSLSTAFLLELLVNNNREWFEEHKNTYVSAKKEFEVFVGECLKIAEKIDPSIEDIDIKKSIFRIYRDARFAREGAAAYKNNFGALLCKHGRKSLYSGFYIHIEPGNSFIAGGSSPRKEALLPIRKAILEKSGSLKNILNNSELQKYFPGGIAGEKLKVAPRGFDKDFPDIELLKPTHYVLIHKVPDLFWHSPHLKQNIIDIFQALYPFNHFINTAIDDYS